MVLLKKVIFAAFLVSVSYAGKQEFDEIVDKMEADVLELAREIEATDYLKPLAERPLMLTMMADLHATSGPASAALVCGAHAPDLADQPGL